MPLTCQATATLQFAELWLSIHLHQVQGRGRTAGGAQPVPRPGRPAARLHTCQLPHRGPPLLLRQLAPQQVVLQQVWWLVEASQGFLCWVARMHTAAGGRSPTLSASPSCLHVHPSASTSRTEQKVSTRMRLSWSRLSSEVGASAMVPPTCKRWRQWLRRWTAALAAEVVLLDQQLERCTAPCATPGALGSADKNRAFAVEYRGALGGLPGRLNCAPGRARSQGANRWALAARWSPARCMGPIWVSPAQELAAARIGAAQ